jgi:hypothetical protein
LHPIEPNQRAVRVIVFSSSGDKLLGVPADKRLELPSVTIPVGERSGKTLAERMRQRWNCEVICLFSPTLPSSHDGGPHYQVAEFWREIETGASPTRWAAVHSLTPECFACEEDYAALQRALDECSERVGQEESRPFARLGWFEALRAWVSETIAPLGLNLGAGFDQFNASPSFSLIRFATSGRPIWFKAVGEPSLHEYHLTGLLAQVLPDFVAPVMARRADWHGWLSPEIPGEGLAESRVLANWKSAADSLARLQIASVDSTNQLLAVGARDLRVARLGELRLPFFEELARLMEEQAKFPPPPLSPSELHWLSREIEECLAEMNALNLPDTLGSCDLNPGNVIVAGDRATFLDWSEAYVGQPFFSLAYVQEHFRRSLPASDETEFVESYLSPWRSRVPAEHIAVAVETVPLLAAFAYAAGCNLARDDASIPNPAKSGYLRALGRRMHLEARKRGQGRKHATPH